MLLLPWAGEALCQKPPMSLDDTKKWRMIDKIELSENGNWVLYNYRSIYTQGNDTTYLYNTKTHETKKFSGLDNVSLIANGKILKYEKKSADNQPGRPATFTLDIANGKEKEWPTNVFLVPIKGSDKAYYVSYQPDGKTDFTFINLLTGKEEHLKGINNYRQLNGNKVIYSVSDSVASTLYMMENGKKTRIGEVKGYISSISDPEKDGIGTVSVANDINNRFDVSSIYTYNLGKRNCTKLLTYADITGLPEGTKISSTSRFINNNSQLLIDLEPATYPSYPEESEVNLELWKWDENVSPRRAFKRTGFSATDYDKYIYDIKSGRCFSIPTKGLSMPVFPDGGKVGGCIAYDETPWYKESDWTMAPNNDVWYVGLNGDKIKIGEHGKHSVSWSPDGSTALVYSPSSKSWIVVNMSNGAVKDLTAKTLPFPMYEEGHDYPFDAAPYGVAEWDMAKNTVTVYDRFDLWTLDLSGKKAPVCITQGVGRNKNITFRKAEDPTSKPGLLYLTGFDENTKTKGLYLLEGGKLKTLAADPTSNLTLRGVVNGVAVWNKENYGEDEYWISDLSFRNPHRITDTNPHVRDLNWGKTRLYTWTNFEGKKNEGILYLPEDYKEGKSYPMIVTFYEKVTEGLNNYHTPEFSSAHIDIPWFVSNGYVVFSPDISYKIGDPYKSCYNAVVSGVEQLIADGIADKDLVGINGHSWGGSQTAWLVTQTDIFKCASPCSAVTDQVADYLMLRGTGQPNMYFQEDAQGRLGKTLWEDPKMYLENSPVMLADKIHTPLLIFHGEKDSSVRIYQGMALYFAMRRLGKPAWLLNYRNVGHYMAGEAECRDFSERLIGFFDHYLKGAEIPEWMKSNDE